MENLSSHYPLGKVHFFKGMVNVSQQKCLFHSPNLVLFALQVDLRDAYISHVYDMTASIKPTLGQILPGYYSLSLPLKKSHDALLVMLPLFLWALCLALGVAKSIKTVETRFCLCYKIIETSHSVYLIFLSSYKEQWVYDLTLQNMNILLIISFNKTLM